MRVPVKLLAFGFWLLSLNFAQCQECLRGDIKYADIVPAEKASYADGETVKVICVTGYTGLYKLKCEKGEWKNTIERPCAKKKCSHPGDTPNGDFKLTEGTEFVFGATVVYTCKKGYEMASRINQRTCRAQGWDNAVPVCEVVKCPAIRTDEGVTVLGNAEEGSYGDIIRFECVSSDKMIDGSSEIHCDETGKWSDVAPKCKDITCTAPTIPNGSVVDSQREYKKDATLKYKCKETFKPREGIPKCAKFGWTVKPECDEITCELKSTTAGVKKINPDGKIIFRARESVEITCSEKHWFFFTKETRKTFTCKDDGKWDNEPVCAEITCDDPRDRLVSKPYYWGTMKFGEKQSYTCVNGYRGTEAEATCTRDGWTPNPLCTEILCDVPKIKNAKIVGRQRSNYRINSKEEYRCLSGFKPEKPVQITCDSQGQWKDIQQCIEITCELKSTTTGVKKINPDGKIIFRAGESVEITCSEKHWFFFTKESRKTFTCKDDGKWDYEPVCAEITCDDPRDQLVSRPYYWRTMKLGEKQSYTCVNGYRGTEAEATCTRDGWTPKPLCTEIVCAAPNIPNADIVGLQRSNYKINSRIQYKCRSGFEPEESVQITCDREGQWRGIKQCTEMCAAPTITNAEIERGHRSYYRIYSNIQYKCRSGFEPEKPVQITCDREGQWRDIQQCTKMCATPTITNAEIEGGHKSYYKIYSNIQYKCHPGFEPEEFVQITCDHEGQWRGIKQCSGILQLIGMLPLIPLNVFDGCFTEMCAAPNITNAEIEGPQRSYYRINSSIQYNCHPGFEPEESVQITCESQGHWTSIPQCSEMLCPNLSVENGFIYIDPSNKKEILYSCDPGYKPFTGNWWDSVTCRKGSLSGEARCIRKEECGALPSVHHGKLTLRDQDTADVECDPGFMSTEHSIKCTNGRWEKPVCKEVHCDIPPNVENAVIISEPEEFYVPGSTVTYVCRSSYLMNEKSTVVCRRGTSEKPPTCQGQREITCQSNGEWSSPLYKCEETKCVAHLAENIRSDELRGSEVSVRQGQTITLSCVKSGSALQGQSKITCQSKGEWSSAFPKCISQTTSCGPPPDVNDADTIELKKDEYTTGERVEYSCFSKYRLDLRPPFSSFLTCDQGEWRGNINCLKPCTVTVEEMERRGIDLAYVNHQKMFAPHNDYVTFACQRGKFSVGVPLRQQCNDGVMTLPECK
ncbi:complement factor H isoform X6 [Carassius gibelio]|uniref:complement factor H isoform X6 n=1 Tax=Carassius gibelio TaxID=101364 RepID=UPI00227904DA|nr:complement factor H isoform X6 [Carassius gibelio]